MKVNRKSTWAWILYDFGNSAFATTVVAGFFPVFFKKYWSAGVDVHLSTSRLGFALGAAGIIMAILAPLWGRQSDIAASRKKWLASFAAVGVILTASLFWIPEGAWSLALLAYVGAYIGFEASVIFYDSMIVDVATRPSYHKVSALGYAFGYLGGGLLFALNVVMTLYPERFGFSSVGDAVRFSFLTVALWWGLFTFILYVGVKENPRVIRARDQNLKIVFVELLKSFRKLYRQKTIFYFLLAYWFYIDGVYTIYTMAIDFGLSLGLDQADLMKALLITQLVGFPSALVFARLSQRYSTRRLLFLCLFVYSGVLIYSTRLQTSLDFMILAGCVGLVQGGVQALSRSYYAHLIPSEQSAEYFGFFNIIGKSASFLGPVLVATVTLLTKQPRLSLLSIIALFMLGIYFLSKSQMSVPPLADHHGEDSVD